MLWLLLCLLPPVGCSRIDTQYSEYKERHSGDEVGPTTRPHIFFCRSTNMEDFSCWWHPLSNLTDGEEVSYVLTYSKDKGPKHGCPDYETSGPNSCHFDSSHTSIWNLYCMNVTAVTAGNNYTSQEHCLDVAEIVQTEAPVNLTYMLVDAGGDELGHNVLLSWSYPLPSDLRYGWITLVYELQYRRVSEPDNWKVKHPLREPHVELLGLPVSDYLVRVRCRSHNYGLWSRWSGQLLMSVPTRPPAGKLLVLILVTGVGVVALLVITFGVIPQSKRIKDYFLQPIPNPRILGIDPLLLKKGNFEEINRHLSNFHGYRPPSYTEEVWNQISADVCLTTPKDFSVATDPPGRDRDSLMVPCDRAPRAPRAPRAVYHHFQAQSPYVQSLSPYCSPPPEAPPPPQTVASPWLRPGIVSLPGTDYSVMEHLGRPVMPPPEPAVAPSRSPQDFYTCVQLMNESGELHLVPCLPPAYCDFPPQQYVGLDADRQEKQKKLADYQVRKNLMKVVGGTEKSEAGASLLPVANDNTG